MGFVPDALEQVLHVRRPSRGWLIHHATTAPSVSIR
jgi:hypothetical protein